MDNTEAKYEQLYQTVLKMRDLQIKSERFRCSDDRAKYLLAVRKLDDLLKAETKERKSLQAKIF